MIKLFFSDIVNQKTFYENRCDGSCSFSNNSIEDDFNKLGSGDFSYICL